MEQVIAIAAASVCGANPYDISRFHSGIGSPRHIVVARKTHRFRQIDIPPDVGRTVARIGRAVLGQKIFVVGHIEMRGLSPLLQIAEAGDCLGLLLRFPQRRQQERRENRNDGDDDEQLNEREPAFSQIRIKQLRLNLQLHGGR
jgi:hypothetical protein